MRNARPLLALLSPLVAAACGRVLESPENVDDHGASDGGGTGGNSGADGSSASSSRGGDSGLQFSGSNGGGDSGDAGECPPQPMGQCPPGSATCSGTSSAPICGAIAGTSAVQTCGATALWGTPWPCAAGTCSGGACTGSTTSGASCQVSGPGLTDCGASGESCCTSLEVAGGSYFRTYTNSGPHATGVADPATVSGFRLDKYLVTVGRFRPFVAAWNGGAGYVPPAGSGKHTHLNGGSGLNATMGGYEPGWVATDDGNIGPTNANLACDPMFATWTSAAGSQENLPIDCVNWYESYAFCIWDGGFLPSEAEWEYAAAGGIQQQGYPWGFTEPGTSNEYAIEDCDYPSGSGICMGVASIAPVGTATLGAGLWGQLDLLGELKEWNLDFLDLFVNPCRDCVSTSNTMAFPVRVARGGDFQDPITLDFLERFSLDPTSRVSFVGFRCARTP